MARPIPERMIPTVEACIVRDLREATNRLRVRRACCLALGLHGLRSTEICNLTRRDHDRARRTLRVRTIKRGRPRLIQLHALLSHALETTSQQKQQDAWLVPAAHGEQLDQQSLQYYGTWLRKLLKVPISFHSLRHSAALKLYAQTRDVYAVQQMLGHRTLRSTHVYLSTYSAVPADAGPNLDYATPAADLHVYTERGDSERATTFRRKLIDGRMPPPIGRESATAQKQRQQTASRIRKMLARLDVPAREHVIREMIMSTWPRDADPPGGQRKTRPAKT